MEVLDRAAGLRRLGGDEQRFKEAVLSFHRSAQGELKSLTRALKKRDAPRVARQASALQEAAASVGAAGMEHVASCLVKAADAGDLEEAATLLDKLKMEFEWLSRILDVRACSGNL